MLCGAPPRPWPAARRHARTAVLCARERVDLRVGVEVAHSLDVNDDQLVAGSLKGEVGEGLGRHPLRSVTVIDETGVGIVLDVFSVDVMFNVEEWRLWSVDQFNDSH